jgi:DNA-binding helix-hairpin-helix protein with protein kinase domain
MRLKNRDRKKAARQKAKAPKGSAPKLSGEIELGAVLAEGGEGRIHALVGRPGFVAKVYHHPPDEAKVKKLEAMIAAQSPPLTAVAAWPLELLRSKPGGPVIGVVLPHVSEHQDIHLLYGPRSRLGAFPHAGFPFLIRAATNLARAFAVVHAHGHVVGDVNDRVALVSQHALVRLIDCDGFQITHGGKTFPCDVGVQTHQPPELQGVSSFRGLPRTIEHDGFGLAVLVFQLLFMARHPFSGSYGSAGDMPLEKAIREFRFVYGRDAEERGLKPPPAALDLSVVTRDLSRLFEQAFGREGVKGRPSAVRWVGALEELGRLVQPCRTNPSHAYLKGRACPFCALDRETELALFHQPVPAQPGRKAPAPMHLPSLWKEIGTIEAPGPEPELPATLLAFEKECSSASHGRRKRWAGRIACVLAALLLLVPSGGLSLAFLLLLPTVPCHRTPGGSALAVRTRDFLRRWRERASERAFRERKRELEEAKRVLAGLGEAHARELAALDTRRRQHQLEAFLRKQRVTEVASPDLDRGSKAVLESFGIETALDVSASALAKVRALPEKARRAVLAWRKQQASRFVFDPARGVEPEARARLERATQKRRADLVQTLADGPARLRNAAQQTRVARETLQEELTKLLEEIRSCGGGACALPASRVKV